MGTQDVTVPRGSPPRPVRATRATPPPGSVPVAANRPRVAMLATLSLLVLSSLAAAIWFGTRTVRLQRELAHQSVLLDKSVAKLSERDAVLSALIDADGTLAIAQLASDSSAGMTVYWNRRDGRSLISAFGLEALPRERTYALWVGDSVHLRVATTFNTDSRGRGLSKPFVIEPGQSEVLQLLLTVELANPGRVPSLPAMLAGSFQSDGVAFAPR